GRRPRYREDRESLGAVLHDEAERHGYRSRALARDRREPRRDDHARQSRRRARLHRAHRAAARLISPALTVGTRRRYIPDVNILSVLEQTALSVWLRESPTMWGFPFVLFLHTLGLGIAAGLGVALNLWPPGWAERG